MKQIDTKILIDGLIHIEAMSADAYLETNDKDLHEILDLIKEMAKNLREHIKSVENLNYIERKIFSGYSREKINRLSDLILWHKVERK